MDTASSQSSVDLVRETNRVLGFQERRELREIQMNRSRVALNEVENSLKIVTSPLDVKTLAEKLKQNGQFTVKDFVKVNDALVQNEENIMEFFKVTGALHSLVRELTGKNASFQLLAANCCCNLALGNEKSCLLLTKAAAPYLLSNLDGLNIHLEEICAWTLGNLAGSSVKCWTILHAQGLFPKLLNIVSSSKCALVHSAIYALTHYTRVGLNAGCMSSSDLRSIATCTFHLIEKEPSALWMLYLLSCSPQCDDILMCSAFVSQVVTYLTKFDSCHRENVLQVTAIVRILGNLSISHCAEQLLCTTPSIISVLQMLLSQTFVHVQLETLWLIGNLLNHSSSNIQLLIKSINFEDSLEPFLSKTISEVCNNCEIKGT